MQFSTKRRILIITSIIFFIVVWFFRKFFIETAVGNSIVILFVLGFFLLTMVWCRCPHCKKYLWKLPIFAKYCPYCSDELE